METTCIETTYIEATDFRDTAPLTIKKAKQITWLLYHSPNFPHLHYCLYLEINFQGKYQRNN